ncbi:unnamed protein product, partial [Prorocentrum cordatum]
MSRHAVAHSLRIKFTMQLSSKFIFGRAFMRPLLSTMEVEAAPDWLNIKREAPDGDKPDKGGEKCGKLQRRKNQVESDAVGGKAELAGANYICFLPPATVTTAASLKQAGADYNATC